MDATDLYQEVILDHTKSPRNFQKLEDPDRHARGDNPLCGDTLNVYLVMEDDRIVDVAFEADGCSISKASGSVMTEAVEGRTVDEARELIDTFRELVRGERDPALDLAELGDLAVFEGVKQFPTRVKCATLSWHTLQAALEGEDGTVTTE